MSYTGIELKTTGMGRGRGRRPVVQKIQLEKESEVLEPRARNSKDQLPQPEDKPVKMNNDGTTDKVERGEVTKEPAMEIDIARKPILGIRIVIRNGRYYTDASWSQPVQLPKDAEVNTRLLYVDENDVLYLRYYQDCPLSEEDQEIETIEKLLSQMKAYYSKFQNQKDTSLGQTGLVLNEREVVVVRLKRVKVQEPERNRFISQTDYEYKRAVVREQKKDRAIVELIDDYGIGGVGFSDIFMIVSQFTKLPVQIFQCELAGIELINHRKIIQTVLKKVPIKGTWPDRQLSNHARAKWMGEKSDAGRPRVHVKIKGSDNWIPLKTYVYQNLHVALTPSVNLVENGIGFVYGANREGFLWVRFAGDDELYAKMRFELDNLVQPYRSKLQHWKATLETLVPEDDLPRRERNMAKLYVVLIQDTKTRISKIPYRVKIRSFDRLTEKVKVYCVDDHIEQEVNASEMIPLLDLHTDLSYIAPLIYKVHLYGIKLLRTRMENVKSILTGEMIQISLVHEWPGNAHPPEVSIVIFPAKSTEESQDKVVSCNENLQLTGLSKHFVKTGCAEMMNQDEMKLWNDKNMNMASNQQEKGSFRDKGNVTKGGSEEKLAYDTFMGEEGNHYCFL